MSELLFWTSEIGDRKAPQEFIRILKLERAGRLLKQKDPGSRSRSYDRLCKFKVFQHCVQEALRGVTKQIRRTD